MFSRERTRSADLPPSGSCPIIFCRSCGVIHRARNCSSVWASSTTLAIHVRYNVAPGVRDVNREAFHQELAFGRRRWLGSFLGLVLYHGARNEVLPKKPRSVRVIINPKHELAAWLVNASAASNHLVKGNGRAHILEKHDVPHYGYVHPGGEQVHRGGNEVMPGAAAQVGDVIRAAH